MSNRPFILLSNDDGFDAKGLQFLIDGLASQARLMVVAPAYERSGASHSISLKVDMALQERAPSHFAFDGTPVDCVQFGLRNLVPEKPDLIISGINHGANLANDTLYSGTVGAAMVGAAAGIPSIAVSLVDYRHKGENHFANALTVLSELLKIWHHLDDFQKRVININVPNIPAEEFRGIKVAQLGERIYGEEFHPGEIPNTFRYFHEEPINFGGHDFDVTEIQNGFATLSVLRPSLFDAEKNRHLSDVLQVEQKGRKP
ncbi:MAG: 5'/3'-nucleotidase SurE [Oligoflexus sp.]